MTSTLRLLLAAGVVVLLGRAAVGAWYHRWLAVAVWRAIRPRHVLGAAALLGGAVGISLLLLRWVPGADLGLGRLFGTAGNAVFAPLEEALRAAGPPPPSGPDWPLIAVASTFLAPLVVLLPWLAFVEEEVFRAGLEHADLRRRLWRAAVFGAAHLIMLIPVAAAVAIAAVGAVYGEVYRRGYRRCGPPPTVVLASYRPTRRALRALSGPEQLRCQAAGVFAACVWHTTFNTLVVVLVWASVVASAL